MDAPAAQSLIARVTSGRRSQRMVAILDLVSECGTLSLAELSGTLGILAATARRDLADLADQNLVLRTHGGVSALERAVRSP